MTQRLRLDVALEQRGLAASRSRARDAIGRGTVTVNGAPATKAGQRVGPGDRIAISDPAWGYVSRGALKLIAGLQASGFEPNGLTCLDLGASTGGFTQVLLERGAARVYAVDVGHGQLHPSLEADPRIVSLEGVNATALTPALIPEPIDLMVSDVSFVSLAKIIETPCALCRDGARAILLVKPQFEVGRNHIGKGGIALPGPHVEAAIAAVIAHMATLGWTLTGRIPSPVTGGDGNAETLAFFEKTRVRAPEPSA